MVWLAEDTLLKNREVALKFAPPNIRDDDSAIEELKQETLSGQALAHPNIVRIYDFFIDEESAAICMEYVDGETLARLRTRQPGKIFEPRQVTRWVAQLLDGVKSDAVSKELSKLRAVGLVRSRSRSGDYERVEETCYWEFIEELSTEWGLE